MLDLAGGIGAVLRDETVREAQRHRSLVRPGARGQSVDGMAERVAGSKAEHHAAHPVAQVAASGRLRGSDRGSRARGGRFFLGGQPAAHELGLFDSLRYGRPGARARIRAPQSIESFERGRAAPGSRSSNRRRGSCVRSRRGSEGTRNGPRRVRRRAHRGSRASSSRTPARSGRGWDDGDSRSYGRPPPRRAAAGRTRTRPVRSGRGSSRRRHR